MGGSRGFAGATVLAMVASATLGGLLFLGVGSTPTTGSVSGRVLLTGGTVTFSGTPPAPMAIDMSADAYCTEQHESPVMDSPVRVGSGSGLAGVLIHVSNATAGSGPTSEGSLLDQVGCIYTPGMVVVRPGETVVIRNSDQTLHNVRVSPTINRGFNLGQPLRGIESRREFDEPEVGIPVRCDVHGWMSATIHVIDHGFHAMSDDNGAFELPDLAPGNWTVEAWHPTLGTSTQTVTVAAGTETTLSFEFSG